MSAWIVSLDHVDLLVSAVREMTGNARTVTFEGERVSIPASDDDLGRLLWQENLDSVAYRYPGDEDGEWPGPVGLTRAHVEAYTHVPVDLTGIPPHVIRNAKESYIYQACEHPAWGTSQARAIADGAVVFEGNVGKWDIIDGWGWNRPEATSRHFPGVSVTEFLRASA